MRSRNFRKRIELWETSEVSDGFGGSTLVKAQLGIVWADLRTLNPSSFNTDFGITNTSLAITVKVRFNPNITYNSTNQYIVYRGVTYSINSFPNDPNFDHGVITFIATRKEI